MILKNPITLLAAALSLISPLAAGRYYPGSVEMMHKNFVALEAYGDKKAPIPGYEPSPTRGNGDDKYYDDNQWMVITFLETYELTGDQRYL